MYNSTLHKFGVVSLYLNQKGSSIKIVSRHAYSHQLKVVTIGEIVSHFLLWDANDDLERDNNEINASAPVLSRKKCCEVINQEAVTSNTSVWNTDIGSKTNNTEITSYTSWSLNGDFEVNIQEILSTYPVWSTYDGTEVINKECITNDQSSV